MQLQLRTTPAIQSFLAASVSAESHVDKTTVAALQPYLNDSHVPYALLLDAWTSARSRRQEHSTDEPASGEGNVDERTLSKAVPELTELLKGSEIVFPSSSTPRSWAPNESGSDGKNPQLKSILASIRRDQEAAEYERMTGYRLGDGGLGADEPVFGTSVDDPKAARKLVLTVVNVFFTAASVFVAVMWIGPTVSDNVAWRVLVAFLLALLVLGGEAWLAYRSAFQRPMM